MKYTHSVNRNFVFGSEAGQMIKNYLNPPLLLPFCSSSIPCLNRRIPVNNGEIHSEEETNRHAVHPRRKETA